jgi:hypothetical protein
MRFVRLPTALLEADRAYLPYSLQALDFVSSYLSLISLAVSVARMRSLCIAMMTRRQLPTFEVYVSVGI